MGGQTKSIMVFSEVAYWTSHPTDNTVVLAEPKLGDLILSPLISIVHMLVAVVSVEISEQSAFLLTWLLGRLIGWPFKLVN